MSPVPHPSDNDDEAWTARMHTVQPLGPPEPRPFFFTRLQARLAAQPPRPVGLPTWLRRPAYVLFAGALVLALNADTASSRPDSPASPASPTQITP